MYGSINLPALTTGTSLMKMSGGLGGGTTQMSPMESMKEVFLEIRDNTKETVELLKTMVLGDSTQDKKDAIAAGDVDASKPKGPGILSKVGSAFGSLLPEKGGFMDTLLKLGLAVGGIALLNIFGDKLKGPLANMIKAFKEGKIGEKIGEIVTDIQEYLTPLWDKIKTKVGEFIDNVKLVFNLIVGAAKAVKDYMMQFDTSGGGPGGRYGDGKLDQFEKAKMIKDLKDKIIKPITDAVYGFAMDVVEAIIKGIGAISIISILSRLSPLAAVPGGKPGKGNKPKGKISRMFKIAGLSRYGVAALGGVILLGIFAFAEDVIGAFNDQLDEQKKKALDEIKIPEGKDDDPTFGERLSSVGSVVKGFLAKFIVGNQEGSTFANVLENGFKKGLMGAAIGSISTVGFGALPGFVGGFIFGAVSAAFGEENLKKELDNATDVGPDSPTGMVISYITDMYDRLILKPFDFIFNELGKAGDGLMKQLEKLGLDYSPKPKPAGFLTPYSDETLYGVNANPAKIALKTNAELLLIQEENRELKENLAKSKSIFGFRFGDGYMDTQNSSKILKILDVVNSEITKRGLATPGAFLNTKVSLPTVESNVKVSRNFRNLLLNDLANSIKPIQGPTLIAPTIDKSIKTSNQTINHGGLSFLHQNKTAETVKYSQVIE